MISRISLTSIVLFAALLPRVGISSEAGGLGHCGEYSGSGIIRIVKGKMRLVVNEGTKSAYFVAFPTVDEIKIAAYLDYPVKMRFVLNKAFNGTEGVAASLTEGPQLRAPDPLDPRDTGFTLVKKQRCQR